MLKTPPQDIAPYTDSKIVLKMFVAPKNKKVRSNEHFKKDIRLIFPKCLKNQIKAGYHNDTTNAL